MVDMSVIGNITGLQGLAYYTNNAVDGVLFQGGVIVLFVVMMMVLMKNDEPFINAFAVSSWSMFVLSGIFWFAQLVPTIFVLGFLFCAAFSVLYLYASK